MSSNGSQNPWNNETWSTGVDSWWKAMNASRQYLEDLGEQVQHAVRGGSDVRLDDFQQVVCALGLVEERLNRSAEQGDALAQRLDGLESQMSALTEQVALVARTVSALGGHVEKLAARPAPRPAPAAKKTSRAKAPRKPKAE